MQGSTFLHHQYLALVSCFLFCVISNHTTQQNDYPRPTQTADSSDETRYPCGACDISVKWDQRAVACESCGQWFHLHCQDPDMNSTEYEDLGKSDATWHCVVCANANYSPVAYDLFGLNTSQNVSRTHSTSSFSSIFGFEPTQSSTPTRASKQNKHTRRPLRLITVTCCSVVGKTAELANLIDSTQPDIILGTESWLTPNVSSAEVFPRHYAVHRRDRKARLAAGSSSLCMRTSRHL